MTSTIAFRCSNCNVRLKAPVQLQGQWRKCPGCGRRVIVPPKPIQDAGPILVFDDRREASYPR